MNIALLLFFYEKGDDHCCGLECLCPPQTRRLEPYGVMVLGGDRIRRWDF